MPKPNHICKNPKCGKAYYACETCEKIGSWKAVACSPSCFQAYVKMIDELTKPKTEVVEKTDEVSVDSTPKTKAKSRKKTIVKEEKDESAATVTDE